MASLSPAIIDFSAASAPAEEAARALKHLATLQELYPSFPSASEQDDPKRMTPIALVDAVAKEALKRLNDSEEPNLDDIKNGIQSGLSQLRGLKHRVQGNHILGLYFPNMKNIDDASALRDKVISLISDLQAVNIPPLRLASAGKRGPTALVYHPHFTQEKRWDVSYVLKKVSGPGEFSGTLIYQALAARHAHAFHVPNVAALDFQTMTHTASDHSVAPIEGTVRDACQMILDPKGEAMTHLLLLDRVRGENLHELFTSSYTDLDEEGKKQLFYQLGKLALADLILGNLDRFNSIGFVEKEGSYQMDYEGEANLGNAIIRREGSSKVQTVAIDNDLDSELLQNPVRQRAYLAFITDLLRTPSKMEQIADNTQIALMQGISREQAELSEHSTSAIQDLKRGTYKKELLAGLNEMRGWFMSRESSELTQTIQKAFLPPLSAPILQRMKAIQSLEPK